MQVNSNIVYENKPMILSTIIYQLTHDLQFHTYEMEDHAFILILAHFMHASSCPKNEKYISELATLGQHSLPSIEFFQSPE